MTMQCLMLTPGSRILPRMNFLPKPYTLNLKPSTLNPKPIHKSCKP